MLVLVMLCGSLVPRLSVYQYYPRTRVRSHPPTFGGRFAILAYLASSSPCFHSRRDLFASLKARSSSALSRRANHCPAYSVVGHLCIPYTLTAPFWLTLNVGVPTPRFADFVVSALRSSSFSR